MSDDLFESSDANRTAAPLKHARSWTLPEPLRLANGRTLSEVTVVYETFGTLNADRSNAVCICHALSGDSHVARHDAADDPGWWDIFIGPGKPIDTDKFFVICSNILGGCRGTTGPDSVNPQTGKPYGADFPPIVIADIVEVQRRLVSEHFKISRLLALVGGSLGGFMALDWATRFPESVVGTIALATSARVSSQALAFDVVARNAILHDPHFYGGQYYDKRSGPATGLAIARMLAHVTYLSRTSMEEKFDDERNVGRPIDSTFETRFAVGSYLAHQGDKFVERFDANSYVALSLAIDLFDLGETPLRLAEAFGRSRCRWLVISFSSDWLFTPEQSRELVTAALSSDKRVTYCNVKSGAGHDAFLLPNELQSYGGLVASFLNDLAAGGTNAAAPTNEPRRHAPKHRIDYDRILDLIEPGKSVLDLGCGEGDLLLHLRQRGEVRLVGLEVKERCVLRCAARGLDVIHANLDEGLSCFYDKQFDYVVLSKTLQTVREVELVLDEMLRVGREAIVSFPNFGYHRFRTELEMFGTAPQTDTRPGKKWYNTSDVRFLTIADFEALCDEKGYKIHHLAALDTERGVKVTDGVNVEADVAIVVLSR